MTTRIGDWMQTATGRQFWPLDPRSEEVFIEDIAHSLANQCRFAGHCRDFYSVAEHSVRVSRVVPMEERLAGLLHDAAEAYLVDLPRPVKRSDGIGPIYMIAEKLVACAVAVRFGLVAVDFESIAIKRADNALLMTEARDLMAKPPVTWKESGVAPLAEVIEPWSPRRAHAEFLQRFYMLYEKKHMSTDEVQEMVSMTRGG